MTEPICWIIYVVKSSVVDCRKDDCPMWDDIANKCYQVGAARWARIPHEAIRSVKKK